MEAGTRVKVLKQNKAGVIREIIGNVAIVNTKDGLEKHLVSSLVISSKEIDRDEFILAHSELLSTESIIMLVGKGSDINIDFYRALLVRFGATLSTYLFDDIDDIDES